jgi:hypothetical protein
MSEIHVDPATTSSAAGHPFDASQCTICEQCNKRYIEPHEVRSKGPKASDKGTKYKRCRRCRGGPGAADFPKHLMVPDNLIPTVRKTHRATPQLQASSALWLASLTPDQESILVHDHRMLKRLGPATVLRDLPRATPNIRWGDLSSGLRDIYSLDRLFVGFESLRTQYASEVHTVAPIGFLAVSLNNAAVDNMLPCKLSSC